eukprot:846140-Alexandrium_andersonii.AAC.1
MTRERRSFRQGWPRNSRIGEQQQRRQKGRARGVAQRRPNTAAGQSDVVAATGLRASEPLGRPPPGALPP